MNESSQKNRENVGTAILAMWGEMNDLKTKVTSLESQNSDILRRVEALEKRAS